MKWFIGAGQLRKLGILGMNCRNIDVISRYNPRHLYPLVDDKLKTKNLAGRHGIPMPELLFFVKEQHRISDLGRLMNNIGGFVVKPAKGSGGKGILVIRECGPDNYIKSSGAKLSLGDIKRHVSNIMAGLYSLAGAPDVAIVEELVQFDDLFDGFSHEGVPDIRIIVFRGYPVMAMLRLATRASDGKANLHQGAVGVGLDIGSGRPVNAVQYSRHIECHPDTGRAFDSIRIPHWTEMLELASRCYEITGLGYLGADIVLDKERGPLLLELNARPGLAIQIANSNGLLHRIRFIENIMSDRDEKPLNRVHFAMEAFGEDPLYAERRACP